MPDKLRQPLALAVLFGGGLLIWLMTDMRGLGLAALGFWICWLTIGNATGYWVGAHGPTEHMVTELMRRIRERRAEDRRQG